MTFLIILGALMVLFLLLVRFTIVDEGTAKAVMTFGKFSEILFQWDGHWMDAEWKILQEVKGVKSMGRMGRYPILGGLYFYGFWPIHRIHRYNHRWTDVRMKEEGKINLEFHEEELNHVLLRPAVYAIRIFAVETAPPERIPIDVFILITLKIENPYLFLFVAPPTPIEDVLARIGALMRETITGYKIDDLLKIKGSSLWNEKNSDPEDISILNGSKLIEETLQKWGLRLADKGIEFKDIDFSPEYQKAAAAEKKAELEASAEAAGIIGKMIKMMAVARGKDPKEVQIEIDQDSKMKELFLEYIMDINLRLEEANRGALTDIRVNGAEGVENSLLNLIGAWKRMPGVESEEVEKKEVETEMKKLPSPRAEKIMKSAMEALKRRKRRRS